MKRFIWLAAMVAGSVSLCSAQELTRTEPASGAPGVGLTEEANPWVITGGFIYKNWLYEHDGLQQRTTANSDLADQWEKGDTDGSGWGFESKIGRGDGHLNIEFMKSDFHYKLTRPNGSHTIDTIARDFEISWSQIRGRNNQAEWGSTLGFRYLGMQKDATFVEGTTSAKGDGNINWVMLLGGYDSNWRPFDTPLFQAHGFLHFYLGEARGTARSGSDDDWEDGVISETYVEEYSLAYGARAGFGVDVAMTKTVRVSLDYTREWLYSFDATDTGIVVFPDNNDALFIENHHALVAKIIYLF